MAGERVGPPDTRGNSEKFFEGTRNFAMVVAFLGALAAFLALPLGGPVFVAGGAGAAAGEGGRRITKKNK